MRQLDLRHLVLGLSIVSLLLGLAGALYASTVVQRDILASSTLEDNRVFAQKLAHTADVFLRNALSDLAYGATTIGAADARPDVVEAELRRMRSQGTDFNAVAFVRADGVITAQAPPSANVPRRARAAQTEKALNSREARISAPFITDSGRWVVSISQPVFLADGSYGGMVLGALFLHEPNGLSELLGEQEHRNGTQHYVVDAQGVVLYHPKYETVGAPLGETPVVAALMRGEEGAMRLDGPGDGDLLAGYALVRTAHWGLVVQRPVDAVLARAPQLVRQTLFLSLPWLCLSILCVWWLANRIVRPLSRLAAVAIDLDQFRAPRRIEAISAWYREADQIKRSLAAARRRIGNKFDRLRQDSLTDALTGTLNRRGLDQFLSHELPLAAPVGVLAIDIDLFKSVNDEHGHAAGDTVLQGIAALLVKRARSHDIVGRLGGEEFVMLLPGATHEVSLRVAERIRADIEGFQAIPQGARTVSVGVAAYPQDGATLAEALGRADQALYRAKAEGRNRVCSAHELG
ncbi:sensor domain-containing diguanylate cyclase [Bordetella genomosp. 1]|uniref:diguanylate cyclase n=1 Tax=Bordetella genomosp. 1 TaxID=1395607 RepID=A0A261SSW6_9BORD|nr:sensor domain-containing diguanylate cyclase [Bordetella genomosp. 1]